MTLFSWSSSIFTVPGSFSGAFSDEGWASSDMKGKNGSLAVTGWHTNHGLDPVVVYWAIPPGKGKLIR